jgi:hypothetical protein
VNAFYAERKKTNSPGIAAFPAKPYGKTRMYKQARQIWCEQDGILSFEWVMLTTLMVIGVVGGSAARDAIIDELGTPPGRARLDNSYTIAYPCCWRLAPTPLAALPAARRTGERFELTDVLVFTDCARASAR